MPYWLALTMPSCLSPSEAQRPRPQPAHDVAQQRAIGCWALQFTPRVALLDEAVLRNMGDEALGILTACWYSAEINNPVNQKFADAFRKDWKYDPGFYAAATYTEAAVLEATLGRIKGNIEDKPAFMKAVRSIKVDTCRGPVSFDQYGNVVGNVYIRRVARKQGRLVNEVVYTYPNVSQFWTYKPDEYLKNPPYTRDYPPAKNLES